ncbi:hypothetical protein RJ640_009232 [Escallonia rubra]|uniref:START domain-containing protein n=1 Tax=Escallonia rubra TaxID=112253 RepID=A0AA88RLS8_9ASTE|nr:hypothetical protein RJ640_009232 [Escallonia rubra]
MEEALIFFPTMHSAANRRLLLLPSLQGSPLKYLSVTVFEDCSAEALRDFYMDNDNRKQWDKTLFEYQQLQMDEDNGTEIGRIIKKKSRFKFPFLTPREYILAWILWEGKNETYYCFSKATTK